MRMVMATSFLQKKILPKTKQKNIEIIIIAWVDELLNYPLHDSCGWHCVAHNKYLPAVSHWHQNDDMLILWCIRFVSNQKI